MEKDESTIKEIALLIGGMVYIVMTFLAMISFFSTQDFGLVGSVSWTVFLLGTIGMLGYIMLFLYHDVMPKRG